MSKPQVPDPHGRADFVTASKAQKGTRIEALLVAKIASFEALCVDILREEKAKPTGEASFAFLARLPPALRNKIATPTERTEVIALRKSALPGGKVRDALGCSAAELNRWDADGRLPHLFAGAPQSDRRTPCRYWAETQVAAAVEKVVAWQEQDRARRPAKQE